MPSTDVSTASTAGMASAATAARMPAATAGSAHMAASTGVATWRAAVGRSATRTAAIARRTRSAIRRPACDGLAHVELRATASVIAGAISAGTGPARFHCAGCSTVPVVAAVAPRARPAGRRLGVRWRSERPEAATFTRSVRTGDPPLRSRAVQARVRRSPISGSEGTSRAATWRREWPHGATAPVHSGRGRISANAHAARFPSAG